MDTGLNSKAGFILTRVCHGLYLYCMSFIRLYRAVAFVKLEIKTHF